MVVWGVSFSMVGRGQYSHLVTVDTVEPKKQLHLFRNLENKILYGTRLYRKLFKTSTIDNIIHSLVIKFT